MSTEVKLGFSTIEAIRSLEELEARFDAFARKAESFQLGSGMGGGGSAPPPPRDESTQAFSPQLARLIELMEQMNAKAPDKRGPADPSEPTPSDTEAESRRRSALLRSLLGATIGGAGQVMQGNVLGGIPNLMSTGLGAAFGPTGGLIGAVLSVVSAGISSGLEKLEAGALKNSRTMLQEAGTMAGDPDRGRFAAGAAEFGAVTGLGMDEFSAMRRRSQRASGLLRPTEDMSTIALLDRAGIGVEQSSRYMGIGRQFGQGAALNPSDLLPLTGLAQNLGLAANAMFDLVGPLREQILRAGGQDVGASTTEFLARLYATPEARATGMGAAQAATGMMSNNVALSRRMLAPAGELANVMDEIAAYQAGSAAGGGMFGFMGGAADFALNDTAESKVMRLRGQFGAQGAEMAVRSRAGVSGEAARALVGGAGVDTGARADTRALGIEVNTVRDGVYAALRQASAEELKVFSDWREGEGVNTQVVSGWFSRLLTDIGRAFESLSP